MGTERSALKRKIKRVTIKIARYCNSFYILTYDDYWNIVIIDTEKYFSENIFRIREADHVCWKRK